MVDIIIPIYKKKPSEDDLISLHQVFNVLKNYDITIVHPENLDISEYQKFSLAKFKAFDKHYFESIFGYNQLMLNIEFYKSFSKKYILIYQTDAFVFKDDLQMWTEKNQDYIGAPWLGSKEKLPFFKKIWDKTLVKIKTIINYKNNQKTQKDKSLLYNQVGNGGISLRKREKFIEVLNQLSDVAAIYTKPENKSRFYAEDVFFSIEPKRNGILFKKPNYKEACLFAIENKQEKAMNYNNGKLPFSCHRWDKERDFWRKYFEKEGYKI